MTMLQGVQRHRFVEIDRKMYKDPMVRFTVCRSEDTMVRITELVASGIDQWDDLGDIATEKLNVSCELICGTCVHRELPDLLRLVLPHTLISVPMSQCPDQLCHRAAGGAYERV